MFRRIIVLHYIRVGLIYAKGQCTKTEFQCAMGYLKWLQKRVHNHYKRLAERN